MSLSKSFFGLTNYIGKDKDYGDFWNMLFKEFLLTKVSDLSEGQKRKLILACCLASNSSIYLLDEPFINLDVDSQEIIMEAMDSKIHNGAAVIFTSHDQNIKNSIELNLNDYKL